MTIKPKIQSNSSPDALKGMQLSDFRLKVFLFFILVYLYLQMFNQFDQANTNTNTKSSQFDHQANTVLPASKSSVKSFTAKFHFFSAFSSGPSGKVTILVLAHNSIKVKKIKFSPSKKKGWNALKGFEGFKGWSLSFRAEAGPAILFWSMDENNWRGGWGFKIYFFETFGNIYRCHRTFVILQLLWYSMWILHRYKRLIHETFDGLNLVGWQHKNSWKRRTGQGFYSGKKERIEKSESYITLL